MAKPKNKLFLYPAVFEPAQEGGYNVSFPSFPGCVTFGRTFEEAKEKAKEVLQLWIEELTDQGEQIPTYHSHPIIDQVETELPSKIKSSNACSHC